MTMLDARDAGQLETYAETPASRRVTGMSGRLERSKHVTRAGGGGGDVAFVLRLRRGKSERGPGLNINK